MIVEKHLIGQVIVPYMEGTDDILGLLSSSCFEPSSSTEFAASDDIMACFRMC